jgi:hypothetical protein
VNLTEQAFRRLAKRVVSGGLGGTPAAKVLTAADYAIPTADELAAEAEAPQEGEGGAAHAAAAALEPQTFEGALAALGLARCEAWTRAALPYRAGNSRHP